jgi:hypothetical protein
MRRPTRPFAVEPESRRKPAQGSASDEDRDRLIDEPAPDEVPSRDVHEDAPASGGDDAPPSTTSLGDPASSAFAPQRTEPPEASPVPASASEGTLPENRDGPQSEAAPKRRRTLARSSARAERVPDRDGQAAMSTRPAMMLEEQVSVAEPSAPVQERHPVRDAPR